jgi:hypothetical protein
MKTPKLYDSTRHPEPAANIAVVGKLTVLVHQIAPGEVLFVLNPNLQSFHHEKNTEDVSFVRTDDTVLLRLTPKSAPVQVSAAGARYEVSLVEIGSESMPQVVGRLDYCIFDVSPLPSPDVLA